MADLKRVERAAPAWPAAFVDIEAGTLLHEDGASSCTRETLDLARLLRAVAAPGWKERRPRNVYLIGGWNAASTPPPSWFLAPAGWVCTSMVRAPLLAKYKRLADNARVTLYGSGQWWGACDDIELCRVAHVDLKKMVRRLFDGNAVLAGTPARSGLDLLERSLPLDREGNPYIYPPIPDDLADLIEHNIGQGRIEWLADPAVHGQAEALYSEDASWMYWSCCGRLPVWLQTHDALVDLAGNGYQPAFYRVTFRVPDGWKHVGILPTWDGRQIWPRLADGREYEAIVNGELIRLAREHGWPVEIRERWIFADERTPGADPLRTWRDKLKTGREESARYGGKLAVLLRGAFRSLCINTVGAWHRGGRYELEITPADELPAEAVNHLADEQPGSGLIAWWKPAPLAKETAQFHRPEWAAMVWLRAQARLIRAALKLPFADIVALRTDEIITIRPVNWPDDGKPGTFRAKGAPIYMNGQPLPTNDRQFTAMRRQAAREAAHA